MSRDPVSPPRPPASELASRRERLLSRLPADALVVLRGAHPGREMRRFRQSNEFYYLTGLTVPGAYALLDPRAARTSVYVPHRDAGRERSDGPSLAAEDHAEILALTGADSVAGPERLPLDLAALLFQSPRPTYTPFAPAEGVSTSRDSALASLAWAANDPFGSDSSPEAGLAQTLHAHFPQCEVRDLSPVLDELRLHKSAHEVELLRRPHASAARRRSRRCDRPLRACSSTSSRRLRTSCFARAELPAPGTRRSSRAERMPGSAITTRMMRPFATATWC